MITPRLCPSCHVNPVIPNARAEVDGRAYRYQRCQHCTNKGAERQARLAAQTQAERRAMLDLQPSGRMLAERLARSRRALEWTEHAMLCDIMREQDERGGVGDQPPVIPGRASTPYGSSTIFSMQRTPSHEEP